MGMAAEFRHSKHFLAAALAVCFAAMLMMNPLRGAPQTQQSVAGKAHADPWIAAQTIEPAALAKELADSKTGARPIIACVGFHTLYQSVRIPGAFYRGPAQTPQGLADLKKWAEALPRASNIVLYCGCCPIEHCPNVRPAFSALREMGFRHVRVLLIPTDFHTDWAQPGFPTEKSAN